MFELIIPALALIGSMSSEPQATPEISAFVANAEEPTVDELCTATGNFAQAVMESRQNGLPMSQVLTAANGSGDTKDLLREIIILAYERPSYVTAEVQSREIANFRNDVEAVCFREATR